MIRREIVGSLRHHKTNILSLIF